MKIGYPCINRSIGCTANSTFRLKNYSKENLIEKVTNNLNCLQKILEFNVKNDFLFFRISSDIVPFASHPVCRFKWNKYFKDKLNEIGKYIKKNKIRISMHPDQFTLINAKDNEIIKRSIRELKYHCQILDALQLDMTAKVQIHVGGVYGDKEESIKRFVKNFKKLPINIKRRLAIENDDRLYSLQDCLKIVKTPIIFDSFHHECFNNGEPIRKALLLAKKTWRKRDGVLMVDYSSQKSDARRGSHTEHINLKHFKKFIKDTKNIDFDLMLEVKDKEKSALQALKTVKNG